MNTDLITRLREFMDNEARSCSMDLSYCGRIAICGSVCAIHEEILPPA